MACVKINAIDDSLGYFVGDYDVMPSESLSGVEADALMRSALTQFEQYVNLSKKIPSEVVSTVTGIDDLSRLADTLATHMTLSVEQNQEILATRISFSKHWRWRHEREQTARTNRVDRFASEWLRLLRGRALCDREIGWSERE